MSFFFSSRGSRCAAVTSAALRPRSLPVMWDTTSTIKSWRRGAAVAPPLRGRYAVVTRSQPLRMPCSALETLQLLMVTDGYQPLQESSGQLLHSPSRGISASQVAFFSNIFSSIFFFYFFGSMTDHFPPLLPYPPCTPAPRPPDPSLPPAVRLSAAPDGIGGRTWGGSRLA